MRFLALLIACTAAGAADEFTVYELLPPNTHQFDIVYEGSTSRERSVYLFNPIRPLP